ncbi:MAG TPA: NAD(P)/FAD-dependent oxidoreductase, partial [Pyrinomonadaceae bacterium]|nr:NAD(P)/FAD-dependent oxidoreductase [Pyrinomonadaceae bacterium]
SRARMDDILLQRAREVGVTVLEETQVVAPLFEGNRVCGARIKSGTEAAEYQAGIIIDATGRARALARRVQRVLKPDTRSRPTLLAFKAHLRNADVSKQTCEIYFYPGGYGGISSIEDDLSNLCFIAPAKDVRLCGSDPEKVIREVVWKNSRAAKTLAPARVESPWLGVSLEGFGRRDAVPAEGLLVAGDAAAFIDPFTGSGILMALEAGKLVAETILDHLPGLMSDDDFKSLEDHYRAAYAGTFNTRLRVCALLRTAAFVPGLAGAAILFFSANERLRKRLAISTRPEHLLD